MLKLGINVRHMHINHCILPVNCLKYHNQKQNVSHITYDFSRGCAAGRSDRLSEQLVSYQARKMSNDTGDTPAAIEIYIHIHISIHLARP